MNRFQVDLGGMVSLLSQHLYSGPQVYIRELLQNGVDAITARTLQNPSAPATITLRISENALEVTDTGIGLTAQGAEELLSTIGRSSKLDPLLGLGRSEFIGQFGIGMLAAFMVSSEIEVVSQSVNGEQAVRWVGYDHGSFQVEPFESNSPDVGTTVRVQARPEMRQWFSRETVLSLAAEFGSLLPFPIFIEQEGHSTVQIGGEELPWKHQYLSGTARAAALREYCKETLGFTPLGQIDLEVPLLGISGVAFILPHATSPGASAHRVYVKRMLLSPRTDRLLPDWAFFVRVVAETSLKPTASREALHDDELLGAAQDALGTQIRSWARRVLKSDSALAKKFISTHHLALRSLALSDNEMLELVAQILPYETTQGPMTLAEAQGAEELLYTTTTEAYKRIAAVARTHGLVVVNAGYVYDADILAGLSLLGWRVRELRSEDLVQLLRPVPQMRQEQTADSLLQAREVLAPQDCDVLLRDFDPQTVPAIILRDRETEYQRNLYEERKSNPGVWGDLLGSFEQQTGLPTRALVLNDSSPVVQQLLTANKEIFEAGVESLYLSALMLSGQGLQSREIATMNHALSVLLGASLNGGSL